MCRIKGPNKLWILGKHCGFKATKRGATTMFRHTERLKGLYRDNRWSKLHRNLTRTGTHGFSARHYDAALLGPLGYTIVTR
jgi:hypothetical protein